jgi:hypothetical protein
MQEEGRWCGHRPHDQDQALGQNRALEMPLKRLGIYERDNAQRSESLALQMVLVK